MNNTEEIASLRAENTRLKKELKISDLAVELTYPYVQVVNAENVQLRARLVKLHSDLGWLTPRWPDSRPMTDDEKRVTDDFYLSHFAAPEADNPPLGASTNRENVGPGAASLSTGAAKPEVTEPSEEDEKAAGIWAKGKSNLDWPDKGHAPWRPYSIREMAEFLAAHTAKAVERETKSIQYELKWTKNELACGELNAERSVSELFKQRDQVKADLASSLRRETMLQRDLSATRRYAEALRDEVEWIHSGFSLCKPGEPTLDEEAKPSQYNYDEMGRILAKTAADFAELAKEGK